MTTADIKLNLPAITKGIPTVEVNGVDLAPYVRSLTLEAGAGSLTTLTLRLAVVTGKVKGEARLYLSAEQVNLLARFGWHPPEGATVADDGSVMLVLPAPDGVEP